MPYFKKVCSLRSQTLWRSKWIAWKLDVTLTIKSVGFIGFVVKSTRAAAHLFNYFDFFWQDPRTIQGAVTHFVFLSNITNCVLRVFRVNRGRVEQIGDANYWADQNQCGQRQTCPFYSAHGLSFERVTDGDESLDGEPHHEPHWQETAQATDVRQGLTEVVAVIQINVHLINVG